MMLFILCFALSAAFLFSFATYFVFWYEAGNTAEPSPLAEALTRAGRMAVPAGFLSSMATQLIIYVTYAFGYMRGLCEPAPYAAKTKPPVVCVHGLYHNPSAWTFFRWRLGKAGYAQLYGFAYSSFGPGFAAIAASLAARVLEISREHGGQKVVLIGHSLGGLLIRAVLADPAAASQVAAVITLGTPHQGSKLAVMGLGPLAKGLTWRGAIPASIGPEAASVPKLALVSPIDNMVLPQAALMPPGPHWELAVTAPVCHVGMLYLKSVADRAVSFLDQALFPGSGS